MKTKKITFLICSLVLGATLTNCSSDENNNIEEPKTISDSGTTGGTGTTGSTGDTGTTGSTGDTGTTDSTGDTGTTDSTGDTGTTGDNPSDKIMQFSNDATRSTIVIQAEDFTLNSQWKLRTTKTGFNGTGYIIWEGNDLFWKGINNVGNTGKITSSIQIDEPGIYEFKWRSAIGKNNGESNATTEHNDTFLKFPDADDFFTYVDRDFVFNKDRQKITKSPGRYYPAGSSKNPKGIAGESGNGFMKIFMNSLEWKELSSTWDHNGFRVYVEFKTAESHTIEIAPRSSFHAINQIKFIPVKLQ